MSISHATTIIARSDATTGIENDGGAPNAHAMAGRAASLVCSACGATPSEDSLLFLFATNRVIHGARSGAKDGLPQICGGTVHLRDSVWTAGLTAGSLALSITRGTSKTHWVRLLRIASPRKGTWAATALCGKRGEAASWEPVSPHLRQEFPLCPDCAAIRENIDPETGGLGARARAQAAVQHDLNRPTGSDISCGQSL
jgi:hypothetical protein